MTDSSRGSGSGVTGSVCDAGPEAARAGALLGAVAAEAAEPRPRGDIVSPGPLRYRAVAVAAPSAEHLLGQHVAAGLTGAPVGLVSACNHNGRTISRMGAQTTLHGVQ